METQTEKKLMSIDLTREFRMLLKRYFGCEGLTVIVREHPWFDGHYQFYAEFKEGDKPISVSIDIVANSVVYVDEQLREIAKKLNRMKNILKDEDFSGAKVDFGTFSMEMDIDEISVKSAKKLLSLLDNEKVQGLHFWA